MSQSSIIIGVTSASRRNYLMWLCTRIAINLAGVKAVNLHPDAATSFEQCDGYVLSGGEDISPSLYHQPNRHSKNINQARDEYEMQIARHAIKNRKPVLGICRGAQMLNVAQGGALHQNAGELYEGFVPTRSLLGKVLMRRKINIQSSTLLYQLLNANTLCVNSLHHQAISQLGEGLKVTATDEYGMIQAIENTNTDQACVLGVQWHPEFMLYKRQQRKIFYWLANCCRNK